MELNQQHENVTHINEGLKKLEQFHNASPKSKTSLRRKYEEDVATIKAQWGDLESIREDLGFSRRKMCQLLMVDPSAWTRWTARGASVPPHIYRALELYLLLHEQDRAPVVRDEKVTPQELEKLKEELTRRFKSLSLSTEGHYEEDIQRLQFESQRLKDLLEQREQVTLMWKFILLVNCAAIFYMILNAFL